MKRLARLSIFLIAALACGFPSASTPTPDLFATLAPFTPPTTNPPIPSSESEPTGKIAFVCQIFKVQAANQICLINADGSGFRRLTTDDNRQRYYPSISPD